MPVYSDVRCDRAVSTITATKHSAAHQAMTSQTNRRHMVAVTQFILITIVYVIAFLPLTLSLSGIVNNDYIFLGYYINHLSNFFIYLAVNKEFRNEAKILGETISGRLRCQKHANAREDESLKCFHGQRLVSG